MRIMIVDDEAIVRMGMKTIVEWEKHGHSIVGEAGDGQSAYELAQELRPDIMLVDIIMPKMNGLELIGKIKEYGLDCKFIILSCLDEYKYLQQAISLGASGYFIKNTIEPNEIIDVVQKVSEDISRHRVYDFCNSDALASINKKVVLNEFFNQVIKSNIKQEDIILKKIRSFGIGLSCNSLFVMVMDFETGDAQNAAEKQILAGICQGIVDSAARGYVFINFEDTITALISNEAGAGSREFIDDICYRMTESIKQYFDSMLKIGVSAPLTSINELSKGYTQAKGALRRSFVEHKRQVFVYKQSEGNAEAEEKIKALYNKIMETKNVDSTDEFIRHTEKIRACIMTSNVSVDFVVQIYKGILYHIHEMLEEEQLTFGKAECYPDEIVKKSSNLNELHEYIKDVLYGIESEKRKGAADKNDGAIGIIEKYISENIYRKISLKEISALVHFNPDYLCRFFKKKTGMTLISRIKQVKMDYAAELVKKGAPNADIIQKIGYSSASYFIKDFKKHTGLSPKNYRADCG